MDSPHVRARITMLPTADGGRRGPIFSSYRPQFRYLGRDNDVRVDLLDGELLFPGMSGEVHLTFSRPEFQLRRLTVNTEFELAEGRNPIARGTILEVLQLELATEATLDVSQFGSTTNTLDSLMSLVGQPVTAVGVASLIAADQLESSTEDDLEEGQSPRSYLACPSGGYLLSHTQGRINTLFVFMVPTDEYQAFQGSLGWGLSATSTRSDVRRAFGRPQRSGEITTHPILGRKGAWDRFGLGSSCLHFEYNESDERIRLITVMAADTAP